MELGCPALLASVRRSPDFTAVLQNETRLSGTAGDCAWFSRLHRSSAEWNSVVPHCWRVCVVLPTSPQFCRMKLGCPAPLVIVRGSPDFTAVLQNGTRLSRTAGECASFSRLHRSSAE